MYSISAIVPRGQGYGFTLAGIHVREAHTPDEAEDLLERELAIETNGIVLVDESYLETLSSRMRKKVDESTVPLVVAIPIITKWEQMRDSKDALEHIIRRAVGYRIKLGD